MGAGGGAAGQWCTLRVAVSQLCTCNIPPPPSLCPSPTQEVPSFFKHREGQGINYLRISVVDEPEAKLRVHWEETYRFIERARLSGSAILVHCKMGVSRSASTVLAYLMKSHGWGLDEAFAFLKARRSIVQPNEGFWSQLQVYEGMLRAVDKRWIEQHDQSARRAKADNFADLLESIAGGYRIYAFQLERRFGTLEALRHASVDDLVTAGLPPVVARNIAHMLQDCHE